MLPLKILCLGILMAMTQGYWLFHGCGIGLKVASPSWILQIEECRLRQENNFSEEPTTHGFNSLLKLHKLGSSESGLQVSIYIGANLTLYIYNINMTKILGLIWVVLFLC